MKKYYFASIVLTIAMAFSVAAAESVDLSALSDQQLADLKARIVAEQEARNLVQGTTFTVQAGQPILLVNEGGVNVYLTGKNKATWQNETYYMGTAFENESGQTLSVWAEEMKLNGWTISDSIICGSLASGEKQTGEMYFSPGDALISELSEIRELTFVIRTSDANYAPVKTYGPFTLLFDFGG